MTGTRTYEITRRYTLRTEATPRTLAVGEAFGVSLDDAHTFTVFENFALDVDPGDVIYIHGDSGSGKSTLLKELRHQHPNGAASWELSIDPDTPIINAVGRDIDEAFYLLTVVGLNDAFLYLRKYRELSDGQKYRFTLAKMLESNADAFFVDEFCSILDRDTAKIVAFNMQKVCRKYGKTLFVATAHSDLAADLHTDTIVRKGMAKAVEVLYPYHPPAPHRCSLDAELSNLGSRYRMNPFSVFCHLLA